MEIPSAVRRLVSRSIAEVRPRLPDAQWVKAGAYHLTLHFLGEVEESLIIELSDQLRPVFEGHEQFSAQLGAGGTFPRGGRARIAWIGLEDPSPVVALALEVRAKCVAVGARREERAFRPHLTVARCRRPWPRSAAADWAAAFNKSVGAPFAVSRGVLMSSQLGQGGARYDVVADYPLGTTL